MMVGHIHIVLLVTSIPRIGIPMLLGGEDGLGIVKGERIKIKIVMNLLYFCIENVFL